LRRHDEFLLCTGDRSANCVERYDVTAMLSFRSVVAVNSFVGLLNVTETLHHRYCFVKKLVPNH
jgi:hypothetical protein